MAQYTINHNLPIYKTSRYGMLSLFTDLSITIGPKVGRGAIIAHFNMKESETQRHEAICPRPHNQ